MATVVTRAGKGSNLTPTEADANLTNINTELIAATSAASTLASQITNLTTVYTKITPTADVTIADFTSGQKAIEGFNKRYKIVNSAFNLTIPTAWGNLSGNNYDNTFINYIEAWVVDGSVIYTLAKQTVVVVDVTAPTFTVNNISSISTTTATYNATINEAGTVKWAVSTSATAPTKSAILAGTGMVAFGSLTMLTGVANSASVTGLTLSTTYYTYAYAIDNAATPNETAVTNGSNSPFTTAASVAIQRSADFTGINEMAISSVQPTVLNFGNGTITSPFTLMYWVKWSSGDGVAISVAASGLGAGSGFYFGSSWGSGSPYINIYSGGSGSIQKYCGLTAAIPVNTWVHLAWTFDGTNILMYVNGSLQSNVALTQGAATSFVAMAAQDTTTRLAVNGQNSASPSYFKNKLDDTAIWSKKLSQTEITEAYNSANLICRPR